MLGLVNSLFSEFVIDSYDLAVWQAILERTAFDSGGIYSAGEQYTDAETQGLVVALAEHKNIPVADVLVRFGSYLYPHLMATQAGAKTRALDFWQFIAQVPEVTHFKVRQSLPHAKPPSFTLEGEPGKMTFMYQSERKLCFLAEGLIMAAAQARHVTIELNHKQCMHKGHTHCLIEINGHA